MVGRNSPGLPPGFRFHPTDEELIMHYLRNQATSRPCPVAIIPEVDIYKFDPWELPEKAEVGENEWYFFTPRDRKYPNGVRPNRAAVSGYWKATGTDKAIYSGSKYVGVKKALVFYKGRPPKGLKTDWIMHEYRLSETRSQPYKQSGSMRLDDWVLCRIYKKKNLGRTYTHHDQQRVAEDSFAQIVTNDHATSDQPQPHKFPRPPSLSHLWEFDNIASISQLLLNDTSSYNIFSLNYINQETTTTTPNNGSFSASGSGSGGGAAGRHQLGHLQQPCTDSRKSSQVNQTIFVNPVYEMQ